MQTPWSSLLKQKQYIILYIILGLWFLIWASIKTYDTVYCGYSGYGKTIEYVNGKIHDVYQGVDGIRFPDYGSGHPEYEFFKNSIQFDNYDRYIQCGDLSEADRVNVVRFSVNLPFKFTQITKYSDASEILFWHKEPIEGYVSSSVYRKQKMWRDDHNNNVAWLSPEGNNDFWAARFNLIKSFDIEWLKNEALDEAHLIGIWQRGWLFRSNKPDHYVWVN